MAHSPETGHEQSPSAPMKRPVFPSVRTRKEGEKPEKPDPDTLKRLRRLLDEERQRIREKYSASPDDE